MKTKTILPLLTLIAVLLASALPATAYDLSAQYHKLDEVLEHSAQYISAHERRLSREKARLRAARAPRQQLNRAARAPRQQLNLCYQIYKDYTAFQTDSAITYLSHCIALSKALGNTAFAQSCLALKATQFSIAGYYPEALTTLGQVNRRELDPTGWQNYYYALNHVYGEMGSYTSDKQLNKDYFRKADAYRDSIFMVFPASGETALRKREEPAEAGTRRQPHLCHRSLFPLCGAVGHGP